MILPMSVFFLTLAVLGGLMIVPGRPGDRAARRAPLAFAMLFAGVSYCMLALALYRLAFYLGTSWGFALLFFGPFAGALGAGLLGCRAGQRRRAKSGASPGAQL